MEPNLTVAHHEATDRDELPEEVIRLGACVVLASAIQR
jgi:hypothetical protein